MCIICVMFVQRFASRGRHFTNLHIINIITVILNLFENLHHARAPGVHCLWGVEMCINSTVGLREGRNFGPRFLRSGNW